MKHSNLWKTFGQYVQMKHGKAGLLNELRLMNKDRELLRLQEELDFNHYANLLEVESPTFSEHLRNTHKRIE